MNRRSDRTHAFFSSRFRFFLFRSINQSRAVCKWWLAASAGQQALGGLTKMSKHGFASPRIELNSIYERNSIFHTRTEVKFKSFVLCDIFQHSTASFPWLCHKWSFFFSLVCLRSTKLMNGERVRQEERTNRTFHNGTLLNEQSALSSLFVPINSCIKSARRADSLAHMPIV